MRDNESGTEFRTGLAAVELEAAPARPLPRTRIDRSWSARFHRGLRLTTTSLEIMRRLPGLTAIPVLSISAIAFVFVVLALLTGGRASGFGLVVWTAGYGVMATVAMVGQAVITHRVMTHLDGHAVSNSQSLQAVLPRLRTLAAWACLSLTVGATLRSLERRRGLIGLVTRAVATFVTIAWSAMTFFVLPVILFENLDTAAAIKRSRALVRECWGEGVVGVGALNVLFNLALIAVVFVAMILAIAHAVVLALIVILLAILGFNLLAAVASPIFTVALYRYATTGEYTMGFSKHDFVAAFRRKRTRLVRS